MSAHVKLRRFLSELIGNKPVTEVPGIDQEVGRRLRQADCYRAYSLLGQFLLYRKDGMRFMTWLKNVSGANRVQQAECYHALKSWCDTFL